ncbi:MAG: beta-lactamase family protein [Xanthomonadales bacterium]|nr:beta-lactamase family protein [Gammaproteobacteria bacterium]MBT8054618.1 beta-lactamase family protein [Gammaproteobacteria bacterium]NND58120.1 beta-lactamase family protein [Xanthomonadales bacterium]NNK50393.1 beta-lactamase family protein [Xanthomonadales bacterium]
MMKKSTMALMALMVSLGLQAAEDLDNELALIESWLEAQRAYDRVPGLSATVVHDQETLWSGAFGYADLNEKQPAQTDTIYGICSISKLFTGIAAMQVRDKGMVALEDPVASLLPWFKLQQNYVESPVITLKALLTHSAGLPRESDYPYWVGPDFIFPTREEIQGMLSDQSTLYPADRYYQYSNLGLTLVGEIVAAKSGQDFETYVQDQILTPLHLTDTATGFPVDHREPRIATGYAYPGRGHQLTAMPRYDARGITPAAGFASTALDLGRFASWQFRVRAGKTGEVLEPNTLREMQRVHWMDWDWKVARGLAFGVYRVGDRTLTGHAGDCPGFNTRLFLDPISLYAVSVLANRNRVDVDGYARVMFDILEAGGSAPANGGEGLTDTLDEYAGSYNLAPWDGETLVFPWQGGLAVVSLPSMDPIGEMVLLKRIEGDRFNTVRSDGQPGHEMVFRRDKNGDVGWLDFHAITLPKM